MTWRWEDGSALRRPLDRQAPAVVFRAVCAELGRAFAPHGFLYLPSRPRLVRRRDDLAFELCCWSSRTNASGRFVGLEVLPWVFAPRYRRWSAGTRLPSRRGLLGGGPAVFAAAGRRNTFDIAAVTPTLFAEIVDACEVAALPFFRLFEAIEALPEAMRAGPPPGVQPAATVQYLVYRGRRDLAGALLQAWLAGEAGPAARVLGDAGGAPASELERLALVGVEHDLWPGD